MTKRHDRIGVRTLPAGNSRLWRGLSAVLAFGIRSRLVPIGRVEVSPAFAGLPPRLSNPVGRATTSQSSDRHGFTMSKRNGKIDLVPFIPSSSPVCRAADTALVYCVVLLGLAAAVIALARQVLS
jgi:hypothetical protein